MEMTLVQRALENREFVYRYLWRLFATEPDQDMLSLCVDSATQEQIDLLADADSPAAAAQRQLASCAAAADVDALASEYTRLFVGPARPVAPLWESIYRDPDELLFQQSTVDVRHAYRAAGFEATAFPREADDHLAIELNFMAELIASARRALEAGDAAAASDALGHQARFLEEHLSQWLGDVYERLSENLPEDYSVLYLWAVGLVREIVTIDSDVTTALISALEGAH